jgi:hypothetical protein
MKLKFSLLAGIAALGFASSAHAQTVINITGATAFRAAMNNTILSLLSDGGATTVKYCYVANSTSTGSFEGSNRVIAEGTIGGQPYIIRTNQNGSTQGIASVATQTTPPNFSYLSVAGTADDRIAGGKHLTAASVDAGGSGKVEAGVIGRFAFSDVSQEISNNPTPALPGEGVGVVPFVFVANLGAPAGLVNMTDQLHEAQWSLGQLPLSMYTGNPADTKLVLNTGRNNGSGTRATILAETQYGPFRSVVQWGGPNSTANVGGGEGSGTVHWLQTLGNNGYSSNSFVRQNLARTSTNVTVGTDGSGNGGTAAQDVVIISYLTLSDAAAVTTITGGAGVGAKALTYNGVSYSEANVKNGAYSLWGYQQFYGSVDITTAEQTFFDAFKVAIQPNLNPLSTGIRTSEMNVTRSGGDGGIITPN